MYGDGKTDAFEFVMGMSIIEDMEKEDEEESSFDGDDDEDFLWEEDDDFFDDEGYEDSDEYL